MEDDAVIVEEAARDNDESDCVGSGLDVLADADLTDADLSEIEAVFSRADAEAEGALEALDTCSFLAPGGDWAGSRAPCERAVHIARRNGLQVTSRKRSWGSSGSDHHVSQRRSYAVDLSNGQSPTPQMDRTARQIAAALGRSGYTGGYLTVTCARHNVRAQLIWRAPDHYNHVHFGCRRI